MKALNRNTAKKTAGLLLLATCFSMSGPTAFADDSQPAPFKMTVIKDQAFGKSVLAGSFEKVINKISTRSERVQASFAAQTNLCVAYTKAKQLQEAKSACDAAVNSLQKKRQTYEDRPHANSLGREAMLADLSIALSNQGVLFAASGEHEKARMNFEAAMELDTDRSKARDNMRRLDSIT